MSKLNEDTLFLIFEELQDDSNSLFSCLMVNRLWCESVIPVLWRNPWRYDNINYNNKNYLFATIAFYLPDNIKIFLKGQGITLSPILYQSPLFDYLSFCKSINVDIMNNIISIASSLYYIQFPLQQEFYNLIMRKCPELKYLDMRSIKHQIFYFPEANTCLKSLCELICDTSIGPKYFYGLAYVCHNIQSLIIINESNTVNLGIKILIEFQENIKYFEWRNDLMEYSLYDPYEEILLALEKKADTLNHLKIFFQSIDSHECTSLLKVLPKFHKLKTLIIHDFMFVNKDKLTLKMLIYHDLEILDIDYITLEVAADIIKNNGGHLRKILLRYYYNFYVGDFYEESLDFIHKVYEHCPLIEDLSLTFLTSKEHFIEFEKLLEVCQNLKLLLITSNIDEENQEELLKILNRSAPTNLREIRFFNSFTSLQKTWRILRKMEESTESDLITILDIPVQ
ncbi:hypothetical protein C1645_820968 [Glomus cerebriforme]|uniref:F-box domain-containing protein n=1 Tax=Glomus cerebriforme TaxID=658196 RepID=A0A397T368_9GLOM|nr:hypothetical protein C1645_820968 [Glomus cerebriforme]